MPADLRAWYTPADFVALAARQVELNGEFRVEDMDRLVEHLGGAHGSCAVQFVFSRRSSGRWIGLDVALECTLTLTCQRCLAPMQHKVSERVEFGFVDDAYASEDLPEGIEPVVMDGDRFSPQRLVEDEMIMAVPMAPKHAPDDECAMLRGDI